ncbi:hypothetical protein LEP1GSC056_4188 [Leptospira borgpetersenii str. Brem 328]|uniref:Uncharacterized protein n=1 Tax=Leptospira borgpetersenii str. Brem 328 TaxID=1049780 RepID=A0ABC9SH92_LEPBO|nr:hypothetical protein LEP1GSC056_4188 [Leptospira borgpetersenii str. Brem 328]
MLPGATVCATAGSLADVTAPELGCDIAVRAAVIIELSSDDCLQDVFPTRKRILKTKRVFLESSNNILFSIV